MSYNTHGNGDIEFMGNGDIEFMGNGDIEFMGNGDIENITTYLFLSLESQNHLLCTE